VQVVTTWHGTGPSRPSPELTTQVFFAYAADDDPRADHGSSAAATIAALRQWLAQTAITYWECPRPWPPAIDPESAISRATEACENYLLALSPRSLSDACCLQGLLFALSMNKRIVPLLVETVPADRLPEPLQTLKAIDLRPGLGQGAEGEGISQLLQVLRYGADYYQAHARLMAQALQWERQSRDPALLLRGAELAQYQRWLAVAQRRSQHRPIQLQSLYLAESHRYWGRVPLVTPWLKRWL
jgi:hypothetical protein